MSFQRANKNNTCPICGRNDWCLISDDNMAVICPRPSCKHLTNHEYRFREDKGESGALYLHASKFDKDGKADSYVYTPLPLKKRQVRYPTPNLAARAVSFSAGANLLPLAELLGLPLDSISGLSIGRHLDSWTIPLCDEKGKIVGIRLRMDSGEKRSYRGGKNGLVVAWSKVKIDRSLLYICEGMSDMATLIALGLQAIARPGRAVAFDYTKRLADRAWRDIVIVSDRDYDGMMSARKLAEYIKDSCRSVKVIIPPKYNDMREWYLAGTLSKRKIEFLVKNSEAY